MIAVQENLVSLCRAARPFVKWAGGKSRLASLLLRAAPRQYGTYYEPFLGGGALFFALQPRRAVLNDLNADLIECYRTVHTAPDALFAALKRMKVSKQEFYRWRSVKPETLDSVARAARFIYLNKTCYNGLYRVNKKGQFNTPFGNYTDAVLADLDNLHAASDALQFALLRAVDFREALRDALAGDFIYLDPPYQPVGRYSDFKRYTARSFYESDQADVAALFRELDQRGCKVLLSNSKHPTVERLYAGFTQQAVSMPRFVNCKGDGRGYVDELLISNYEHDGILP